MSKPAQPPLHSGMSASRDDVVRLFGHLEDEAIVEVLALAPTISELEEAQAWLVGQGDVLARGGHPQTPRIAAILDIVADEDEDDAPRLRRAQTRHGVARGAVFIARGLSSGVGCCCAAPQSSLGLAPQRFGMARLHSSSASRMTLHRASVCGCS